MRNYLQQAFHDRGSRGVVVMVAALLRVAGCMLVEIGTVMEIYVAERLRDES